jgi:hypothetical protein
MLKFKRHLLGRKFTWITDCSGLTKFFETDYEATHTIQRWKLDPLRFDFTMVHRPGRMLTDCDMLSRYNTWTSEWRTSQEARDKEENDTHTTNTKQANSLLAIIHTDLERATNPPRIPRTHVNPKVTGNKTVNRTALALAETCDRARTIWIIGQGSETATTAMENLGLEPSCLKSTDETEYWQAQTDAPNLKTFLARGDRDTRRHNQSEETPKWIIVPITQQLFQTAAAQDQFEELTHGKRKSAKQQSNGMCLDHHRPKRRNATSSNGARMGQRHGVENDQWTNPKRTTRRVFGRAQHLPSRGQRESNHTTPCTIPRIK